MPARFADITRALAAFGVTVEPGSKHFKCRKAGFRPFTIPAHNGPRTEISDIYIRALCRNFGIDVSDFKSNL